MSNKQLPTEIGKYHLSMKYSGIKEPNMCRTYTLKNEKKIVLREIKEDLNK